MDGSDGGMDMRMSIPSSTGAFLRHTSKADGSALYLGVLQPLLSYCILLPDHAMASSACDGGFTTLNIRAQHPYAERHAQQGNMHDMGDSAA